LINSTGGVKLEGVDPSAANADVDMLAEGQEQSANNNPPAEDVGNAEEIPTKCHTEKLVLQLRCKIISIDYEGRSDGESIKKILLNIKPRNLIIVHGNEKSTLEMQQYCQKQQLVQDRIFTPRLGDVVNATLETQIYNVRLKDELVSSLKFQKLKDYELAWVDAIIRTKNFQAESETFNPTSSSTNMLDFGLSLHPLPKENAKVHGTVFVNEPKLSDLKQILTQNDIQAEFHGGVLVCNGIVALKKVNGHLR
jgi:cleavage and polyadenylation specificity factor subunit 2